MPQIMTVLGPIPADQAGFWLPHEHVLVDFVGAGRVSPDRYDRDEVFAAVRPHLHRVRQLGCRTFVECTPSYLGKDPVLLQRLARDTGLHILTNTGYYGAADDRFLPAHAHTESADQLAERWVREWEEGIDGTGVRPGFIKIGVDPGPLSPVDARLVRAAARAQRRTGLLILSHTGFATPARQQLEILREEGVDPGRWVWTHAHKEADNDAHVEAGRAGAWLAFDGCRDAAAEDAHLDHLLAMKAHGLLHRVHLSHDAGWYQPGDPGGGDYTSHSLVQTRFLDRLRAAGFTEGEIRQVTVDNPAAAFALGDAGA